MILSSELKPITLTGNVYVDSLLGDVGYVPGTVITYVLQGNTGDTGQFGGSLWAGAYRTAMQQALASWSAVANISFVEAAGPYTGTESTAPYDWIESFGTLEVDTLAQHDLPMTGTLVGTYNKEPGIFTTANVVRGGLGYSTFVHETGHGLGLLHPHNDGGEPAGDPVFPGVTGEFSVGSNGLNQGIYTIMTYNSGFEEVGISPSEAYGWEMGPMAFDIAAIQRIYGANNATGAGNTAYVLPTANAPGTGWSSIWDAGGTDTISVGTSSLDAIIDLRSATLLNAPGGGGFVSRVTGVLGGMTIANGVVIENATGGFADDLLTGNSANNTLNGGAGLDTVSYAHTTAGVTVNLAAGTATGDGSDTLISIENAIGGSGNDTLIAFAGVAATNGADDVIKRADQVINTRATALNLDGRFSLHLNDPSIQPVLNAGIQTSVSVHAAGGGTIDVYVFRASAGPITLDIDASYGIDTVVELFDAAGNSLAINDDRESLDIGSANEFDSFLTYNATALGFNTYYVEVSRFTADDVPVGSSYTLNISASSTFGASGDITLGSRLDGGAGNDVLTGAAGNDTLIGGTGTDRMTGGGGDDTYFADQQDDLVFEDGAGGTDSVSSTASFYLYANVENLTLTGSANLFGVGTAADNVLRGNAGENLLIAGAGNDEVRGGAARDAIFGEDGADNLFGDAGVDYIVAGAGNDSVDGGADADEIYGQDGNDFLSGGATFDTDIIVGGPGDDTIFGNSQMGDYDRLYGNEGNDTFYVDTPNDLVFEQAGEGTDTVFAGISGAGFYLYDNIENLQLTGTTPFGVGNALANQLTGNAVGNYLLGGAGNDVLNGMTGNDVLFGEAGADVFVFEAGTGADVIGDFQRGSDRIQLIGSYTSFAEVQAHYIQDGANGAIRFDNGDVIVLQNTVMSQLVATDFIFG